MNAQTTERPSGKARFGSWLADNGIVMGVGAYAYLGSLSHWLSLGERYGQKGTAAWCVAGIVDLGAIAATVERMRDLRTGREHKGWVSWPVIVMFLTMTATLIGNAFTAQQTAGGVMLAITPALIFLITVSLVERRAAERLRRAKAAKALQQAEEDRQRVRREQIEEEERLQAERDRLRQQALDDADREREQRRQDRLSRDRERQDRDARRQAAGFGRQGDSVTLTVPPGDAPAPSVPFSPAPREAKVTTPERQAMWNLWVYLIRNEGRMPTGAELNAAGGCRPSSSLGRQLAPIWRGLEPAISIRRGEAAV